MINLHLEVIPALHLEVIPVRLHDISIRLLKINITELFRCYVFLIT